MTEAVMAIKDKLETIKKQSESLNRKTDELNATIESIEKGLSGSGVEFWWEGGPALGARIEKTDQGRERNYYVLGYSKVGGTWCVAAQQWTDVELVDHRAGRTAFEDTEFDSLVVGDPVPLTSAPRRVRIDSAEHLESFLEAFSEEIGKMEANVDKANELAGEGLTRASGEDMKRLHGALQTKGQHVEILRHHGFPSASLQAARESAESASKLNAQGVRVARIMDDAKGRRFECGVSAAQAKELLAAGAVER